MAETVRHGGTVSAMGKGEVPPYSRHSLSIYFADMLLHSMH